MFKEMINNGVRNHTVALARMVWHLGKTVQLLTAIFVVFIVTLPAQAASAVSASTQYSCGPSNYATALGAEICFYAAWINAYHMYGCGFSQLTWVDTPTALNGYVPFSTTCGYGHVLPVVLPKVSICPSGFKPDPANSQQCILPSASPDLAKNNAQLCKDNPAAEKAADQQNACTNPVNSGTGNKYQHEVDYVGLGTYPIRLDRMYNSGGTTPSAVEATVWSNQWRSNYDRSISYASNGALSTATVKRENGKQYYFNLANGAWVGDVDVAGTLVQQVDATGALTGWTYSNENNEVETYNASGQMVSIANRAGVSRILCKRNFFTATASGLQTGY